MTITTTPTGAIGTRRKLARALSLLALLLAIAAALLLAAGPLGWRAGLWHYSVGLRTLMPWAAYCGLAAMTAAVLALVFGLRRNSRRNVTTAIVAFVVGAAIAYVPWHYDSMRGIFPPINDITTDLQDPPQFHAVLPLRAAEGGNPAVYGGAKTSEQQRRAYPDIAPLTLELDPRKAFVRAHDAARHMGWIIVASDVDAGRIEASERSRWFGFTDDIAIRIAAGGTGSRIDVRSMSRFGRSDFGVNATRVRAYLAALREAGGGK